MNNKSVVVTGASGFVAGSLVKFLNGFESLNVIPISRSSSPGWQQVSNYKDTPVAEVLIHLAENSDRAAVNSMGRSAVVEATNVCESLLNKGYSEIIYASSASVYGDQQALGSRISEEEKVEPYDTYSELKLSSEKLLAEEGASVLRLANVIGPGMSQKNVLSDIFSQMDSAGPLTVRDQAPVRDFVCISDVVRAFQKMIGTGLAGLFNVGSGQGCSIGNLARIALNEDGQESRKIQSGQDSGPVSKMVLDIKKIKMAANWEPVCSLEKCVKNSLQNYREKR